MNLLAFVFSRLRVNIATRHEGASSVEGFGHRLHFASSCMSHHCSVWDMEYIIRLQDFSFVSYILVYSCTNRYPELRIHKTVAIAWMRMRELFRLR
jgi:hypothetical protein